MASRPVLRPFFYTMLIALAIFLAACGTNGGGEPSATPVTPVKLLATVFVSPTPDAAQREATRLAQPVASPTPPPTRPPQPTVYVGTFLGASEGGAILDPARFAGTLTAPPP
ncbi:MAG: hypothetical protein JNL42_01675 [Anaerolineae bacterium]|nr:hypothetical protein [Anaerolineae bacterium]